MKRNDWILIISIFCVTLLLTAWRFFVGQEQAGSVVVKVDGKIEGVYSLSEDARIQVNGTNIFVIQDGSVKMTEASCPDLYCVNHKAVSKNGESIICLPNKVVLEIQSDEVAEMDAISR